LADIALVAACGDAIDATRLRQRRAVGLHRLPHHVEGNRARRRGCGAPGGAAFESRVDDDRGLQYLVEDDANELLKIGVHKIQRDGAAVFVKIDLLANIGVDECSSAKLDVIGAPSISGAARYWRHPYRDGMAGRKRASGRAQYFGAARRQIRLSRLRNRASRRLGTR